MQMKEEEEEEKERLKKKKKKVVGEQSYSSNSRSSSSSSSSNSSISSSVCSMCGDVGIPHLLCLCIKCCHRYQHMYCSRSYPKVGSHGSVICNWCLHDEDLMVMSGHDSTPQDNNALVISDTPGVINDSVSELNREGLNYSRSMSANLAGLGKLDSICSPRSSTNRPQSGTNCQQLIITKCPDLRNGSPQSSTDCPNLSIAHPKLSKNQDLCHSGEIGCTQSSITQPQSRRTSGGLDPSQDHSKRPQITNGNQGLGNVNCSQLTTNYAQLTTNHPHRRRIEPKEAITKRSNHSKAFDYLLMIIAESFPEEKSECNKINSSNNHHHHHHHHKNDIILKQRIISREGGFMRASERGKNINNLKKSYSMKGTVNKLGISDHLKYRKKGLHDLCPPVKANYRRYKLLADVLC